MTTTEKQKNTGPLYDVLKRQIDSQSLELKIKNEQLAMNDEQLKTMQKLLDQSQQLQLMTEKKRSILLKVQFPEHLILRKLIELCLKRYTIKDM